ncbi:MAG: recombinase family protein [Clostridia bacterium]|nr:recombinase family protein [Clostridia bacterium]
MKKVGYMRVSTGKQNLDRQYEDFKKLGIEDKYIYEDKATGKNFERVGFEYMKRALEKGDILVISSLDRLGRNAKELKEQWEYFKDNKISVQVLDMPSLNLDYADEKMQPITQLINNIIFEIFSWKAESDRVQIVERTKQGLEQARHRGKSLGRPKVEITEEFVEIWRKWKNGEFKTTVEAMKQSKTSKTTFYRLNKILENGDKNNDK